MRRGQWSDRSAFRIRTAIRRPWRTPAACPRRRAVAGSDELSRQKNLALMRPLDRRDIGLGDIGRGEAEGRVHAELHHRLLHPPRADGVDPEPARHLQRRGAGATFVSSSPRGADVIASGRSKQALDELASKVGRRGRGLGPRRRLAPAVRLAGDVGAIAALSPLVPPPTSDYVGGALLAFRAAGHWRSRQPEYQSVATGLGARGQ